MSEQESSIKKGPPPLPEKKAPVVPPKLPPKLPPKNEIKTDSNPPKGISPPASETKTSPNPPISNTSIKAPPSTTNIPSKPPSSTTNAPSKPAPTTTNVLSKPTSINIPSKPPLSNNSLSTHTPTKKNSLNTISPSDQDSNITPPSLPPKKKGSSDSVIKSQEKSKSDSFEISEPSHFRKITEDPLEIEKKTSSSSSEETKVVHSTSMPSISSSSPSSSFLTSATQSSPSLPVPQARDPKQVLGERLRHQSEGILDLSGIGLEDCPEEVQPTVIDLSLEFNKLTIVPIKVYSDLKNIQILRLTGNLIQSLPEKFFQFTKLKELYLNGNQLTEIPSYISKFTTLEIFHAQNNKISNIADEIGYLNKLEVLFLTGNPLKKLPDSFGKLGPKNLEVLEIDSCELTHLPNDFPFLTRLIELNLGHNKLTSLPETIGRMTRLAKLNLMDNLLEDLPLSIGFCFGLGRIGSGINIDRNPIKSPEILQKYKIGADHLMFFLENRLSASEYKLPEFPKEEKKKEAPKKTTLTPEQKAEIVKKVVALSNWGQQHSDIVKNISMELKNQVNTSVGPQLNSLSDKVTKIFNAIGECKSALPLMREFDPAKILPTDDEVTKKRKLIEQKIYAINICMSTLKREFQQKNTMEDLDTVVLWVKSLRTIEAAASS